MQFFLEYLLRIIPYVNEHGEKLVFNDAIFVFTIILFASITCYNVSIRTAYFISISREESKRADRQVSVLREAMEASTEALSKGDALVDSSQRTATLTMIASEIAKTACNAMHNVLSDSRSLSKELDGISDNSNMLRSNSETQSSFINQTSSAVEEMTTSILNIAKLASERQETVNDLSKSTEEGQNVVTNSATSMDKVEASTGAILEIVNIISNVADQTSLLAMNAAIEAAHAGDKGRGFAIVASEIRKLSETTTQNVRAITETVKGTIDDIRIAYDENEKAVSAFDKIANASELVSSAIEEIISGLDEISRGTEEINNGITDSVTSANTLKTAVESLDEQITNAKENLTRLTHASFQVESEIQNLEINIEAISDEAEEVDKIGTATNEGLSLLKKALENEKL